jgi:glycosyltransferase involved in cell wall biosynthesis
MEAAGAQKAMLELARGLKARGHHAVVVTMYDKGDFIPGFQERYGLEIISLQMKRPGERNPLARGIRSLWGLGRLYRLMRRHKIEIVQTFSHYSNIVGPVIAWLARIPVRVSSQRMSLRGASGWLLHLDRLIVNSPLVTRMVSVSEGTRRFCIEKQGMKADKIVTIHNGIDLERFKPAAAPKQEEHLRRDLGLVDSELIITTVARLHPQKGHSYLIQALPRILDTVPHSQFLFVGGGELRSQLEALVRDAGLEDVVRFLGVRQDVPDLLAISDLFVLPSLWEGLPNSVLEAMAAGVPVVATNVDGSPEVVADGETGILVPPADPAALAEAICSLLQDRALRASMAEAARSRVAECFSQEANVAAYEGLYRDLIGEGESA